MIAILSKERSGKPADTLSSPFLWFSPTHKYLLRMNLCTYLEAQILQLPPKGKAPGLSVLVANKAWTLESQRLAKQRRTHLMGWETLLPHGFTPGPKRWIKQKSSPVFFIDKGLSYFPRCCYLMVWPPNGQHLGTDYNHTLWNTENLATLSTTGIQYKEQRRWLRQSKKFERLQELWTGIVGEVNLLYEITLSRLDFI